MTIPVDPGALGRLRAVALGLAAVLVVALATRAGATGDVLPVVGLLAAFAVAATALRPRTAVLVVLALGTTVFRQRLVALDLAGVRTDLVELLAMLLIGLALLSAHRGEPPPYRAPLLLLVGAAGIGAVVAVDGGATFATVLGPLKTASLYLFALAIGACFRTRSSRAFLDAWVLRVATLASAVVLVGYAAGRSFSSGDLDGVSTLGVATETARIRPALLSLLVVAVLLLVAKVAATGGVPWDVARLALFTTVLALSYTRSTWVPLALAAVATALLHPGRRRPTRTVRNALAISTCLVLVLLAAGAGALGGAGDALITRAQSVVDPSVRQDASYLDRQEETEKALETLRAHPVLGVGLAQPYGADRVVYLPRPPRLVTVERVFIHNSLLGVWLQFGLVGLAALVWLVTRTVRAVLRARRVLPAADAARCLAGGFALLSLGLSATAQPVLLHRPAILATALALVFASVPVEDDEDDQPDVGSRAQPVSASHSSSATRDQVRSPSREGAPAATARRTVSP